MFFDLLFSHGGIKTQFFSQNVICLTPALSEGEGEAEMYPKTHVLLSPGEDRGEVRFSYHKMFSAP